MRDTWLKACIDWSCAREDFFWTGARKILSHKRLTFRVLDDSIKPEDIGYTQYKLTKLNSQYFVKDAIDVAMMLHAKNIERKKYASSAFHCYGHLLKATYENRSGRGSVMGPCLQSVVITLRPHERRTTVDVFYRTTEIYKKFPADLVWLKRYILPLIPGQDKFPVIGVTCHFVNVTCHSMYFATAIPFLPDVTATLTLLRDRDPAFHQWVGRWLIRYIGGPGNGRSVEKFAQAKRTADASRELIGADVEVHRRLLAYLIVHRDIFLPQQSRFNVEEMRESLHQALRDLT
jgi:hypothetical protein